MGSLMVSLFRLISSIFIMKPYLILLLLPSLFDASTVRDDSYNPSYSPDDSGYAQDAGYHGDDSHQPSYSPENNYAEEPGYEADARSDTDHYGSIEPLGDTTGKKDYHPMAQDHYMPNEVYKAGDHRDCHFVDKIVYKDECIPYVEKTCRTHQEEECHEVMDKKCKTEVDDHVDRECFDVTELLCQLVESIDYEVIQDSYTVQRCSRTTDRICDTVYDLSSNTQDDFQCVKVENPDCHVVEKIIKDRTCIYSVDFECGKLKAYDGKHSVQCDKVPTKKCYDTPRTIREEVCKQKTDKVCEKLTNELPVPEEKQNCHPEQMKQCELEQRQRPKKARNFVYSKECKPVKRRVCGDAQKSKLKPKCEMVPRSVCDYKPKEKCQDEQKKYCFKTEAKLHEKVCVPERKVILDETLSYV